MDYRVSIPWHILKRHLQTLQSQNDSRLRRAVGEDIYRLQGKGDLLDALMNLPETLLSLEEADKETEPKEGPVATRD